ncbi:MAG TPA: efflux RND transporter periplasmic adaptor subunit [Caulobacteraceae bacterium]|jgi:cobalt-zinc-cadmium efflux system membrane fusion protein
MLKFQIMNGCAALVQCAAGAAKSKRRHFIPAGATAAVAVVSFFAGQMRSPAAAAAPPPHPAFAKVAIPPTLSVSAREMQNMNLHFAVTSLQPVMRSVEAPATVTFNKMHMAAVSAPGRARIEAIDVVPGQHVVPGQRLAILDYSDLGAMQSRVQGAAAAVAQARTEDATAQVAFARAKAEFGVGTIAQSEVERRGAVAASTAATLQMRIADLKTQREAAAQFRPLSGGSGAVAATAPGPKDWRGAIVSPIEGDIDTVDVSPGELADPGRSLITVADLSVIVVRADVPEAELPNLKEGQTVTLHVAAFPGRTFTGTVTHIPDEIDPQTGTDPVLCAIPNPDGSLRVNMFGTVAIGAPVGRTAVMAPDSALQNVNGRQVVFIPLGKGRFVWRAVKTGLSSGGWTEIEQGLDARTPIVANGSYWLKAGLLRSTIPDEG